MSMPRQLGRYLIEQELGQGAMGRVYLGHDPAIDRKVALKIILLPQGLSPADRKAAEERFYREIRAAGRLSHPHIVTIYDVGHDAAVGTFVAMEYVQGRTLEEIISAGALPDPRVVASVGCQAADALAYAHRHGIVHRDIKPANLMLVDHQSVKITDFGLAKPSGTNLTTDGTLVGTPSYMSPEQVEGRAVDGRSDLFSLAVVIYQLLTGKLPFRGDSISTVVYRILHEPPVEPDLGKLPSGSEMKNFLARALAKDPGGRFKDGDAFARALREAMSPAALAAPPPQGDVAAKKPAAGRGRGRRAAPRKSSSGAGKKRAAARGRRTSRKRSAAHRRRRPTLFPVLAILTLLAAMAFIYRDALFAQFQGWTGVGVSLDSGGAPGRLPPVNLEPELSPLKTDGTPGPEAGQGQMLATSPGPVSAEGEPREPALGAAGGSAADSELSLPAGGVRLRSDPEGAVFSVSGRPLPAGILPVPDGDETLLVEAVLGCREGSREITPEDSGQVVTISLQAAMARVRIEAKPGRAEVSIDGSKSGRTPLTVELDACSAHQVKVTRAEYKPWMRSLGLEEGRLQAPDVLMATLEPLPRGTLEAPTPPYPVTMTLAGGRRLKPGEKVSLVANTYRLTLSNDDLLFHKQIKVRIQARKTITPHVLFPPLARLTVHAAPSRVKITIRSDAKSRELGAPPIVGEQIVAGTYTLVCRFEHNGERQEKVVTLGEGENPAVKFIARKP